MAAVKGQQWLAFEDLSVQVGQQMLLYPDPADKSQEYPCQLVGYLSDEALLITNSSGSELPKLEDNQRVVIRINLKDGVALFPANVMFSITRPRLHVYLDLPQSVKFRPMRSALRVNVTLPVLGDNVDKTYLSGVPGKIKDLSEKGAKIVMFQALGQVGDRVILKGKFEVTGVTRNLTVEGIIRTVGPPGDYVYGVEFFEGSEEQRLILANFVFHAMAFGHLQVIQ